MGDRVKKIRQAEAVSHTEVYRNHELFNAGSWLARPVKTVLDLFPCFESCKQLRVLDLGSGVGRNAIPVAKRFEGIPCHIECVDILELAIEKLRENAIAYGVSNSICGIVESIDSYKIMADSYDWIIAVSALEHIESQSVFIDKLIEIKNGLRDNGIACLILNSSVQEKAKTTGELLVPQFEGNIPAEELLRILRQIFSEWKIRKQTVVHQKYDIPRDIGISRVDTDVVTFVVQKQERHTDPILRK